MGSREIIFSVAFLDSLGIGLIIPILPALFFGGQLLPGSPELARSVLMGLLISTYPLAQFFAAPLLGSLSDRFGRKPVLEISLLGTFAGYIIFALGIELHHIWLLFLGRAVDGFTGGNAATIRSVVVDTSRGEEKTRNFGIIGVAFGLGFIIGPFIGGHLAALGMQAPVFFAAALSLANALIVKVFMAETNRHRSERRVGILSGFKNLARAAGMDTLRHVLLSYFLLIFAWSMFGQFFQVYLYERFGFTTQQIGNFFGYIGVWIIISQGVVVPFVSRRFAPEKVIAAMLPLAGAVLVAIVSVASIPLLLAISTFLPLIRGLLGPNYATVISNSAPPDEQGEIMGVQQSLYSFAQTLPAAIAGAANAMDPRLPSLIAAALALAAWWSFRSASYKI